MVFSGTPNGAAERGETVTTASIDGPARRPLRLLALVSKEPGLSPGQRFRLEQWAPILATHHGIQIEFSAFESRALTRILYVRGRRFAKAALVLADGIRRFRILGRAGGFDGVIVYREATLLGGSYLEWVLANVLRIPIIYDFDDAIWDVALSRRNGPLCLVRSPWKTGSICRVARAVTLGNDFSRDVREAVQSGR